MADGAERRTGAASTPSGEAAGVADPHRLEEMLGGPAMAWLRHRVRARLERGEPLTGRATLRDPTPEEREATDRLLGRRPSHGRTLSVPLEDLDRILRDALVADGLPAAVTALDGPVSDRRSERASVERAWAHAFSRAEGEAPPEPWVEPWLEDLRATGLLRRLASGPDQGGRLLADALAVLRRLPADAVDLPHLAARVLGDSHALDDDRPVASVVLKALLHGAGGAATGSPADGGLPRGEERRALWASVGVLLDELVRPVLVLGLRGRGRGLTDQVLAAHADAGEPARLTLGQLIRHPPEWESRGAPPVHVCENPAVVAAAGRDLGRACRPLVCVEGNPASAQQTLLRSLSAAGRDLLYHGDFDWSGLGIGNRLHHRFGARPWRFSAADYRAAPAGPPLRGTPVDAAWDPDLALAMKARGVAVHEEQVLPALLEDLGAAP